MNQPNITPLCHEIDEAREDRDHAALNGSITQQARAATRLSTLKQALGLVTGTRPDTPEFNQLFTTRNLPKPRP